MKNYKKITCAIFIAIELILYYFILFSDLIPNNISSYISICLCFAVSIILYDKSQDWKIVCSALLFTIIADFFLVLLPETYKEIAMLSFCVTQSLYAFRLIKLCANQKLNLAMLITRAVSMVAVVIIALIVLQDKIDALSVISLIYFVNLAINIVHSICLKDKTVLFTIGLVLFIMCDLTIGLRFLCTYLSIPSTSLFYTMVHSSFNFTWLFYLPSQVLITLSILTTKKVSSSTTTIPKV